MIDVNDTEYLEKLKNAVASDDGFLVAQYFKNQIQEEFDLEKIDIDNLTDEQAGREFKSIMKIKKFFENLLIFTNRQE